MWQNIVRLREVWQPWAFTPTWLVTYKYKYKYKIQIILFCIELITTTISYKLFFDGRPYTDPHFVFHVTFQDICLYMCRYQQIAKVWTHPYTYVSNLLLEAEIKTIILFCCGAKVNIFESIVFTSICIFYLKYVLRFILPKL